MNWKIENGLIIGQDNNKSFVPNAKQIFDANNTIDIDGVICDFNIDLSFYKITSKKFKVVFNYIDGQLFLKVVAMVGNNEYEVLSYNNTIIDYIIVGNKWYFIDPLINSFAAIVKKYDAKINDNISFLNYLNISKELFSENIPYLDNVKEHINEIQTNETKKEENYDILFPYQKQGVNWLNFMSDSNCGCILADSMGLGKTLQAIYALRHITNTKTNAHSLVVAPVSLLENWKREIQKFCPSLNVHVNYGKTKYYYYKELLNYDIIVTSYGNVQTEFSMYKMIKWDAIVLDEAQNIKNPRAQRTTILKSLDKSFGLAITGTPFENHLTDIFSIVDFVIPNYFGTLREFEAIYKDDIISASYISDRIKPIMLRRKVEEVKQDLPQKMYIPVPIQMSMEEAKYYDSNIKSIDKLKTARIELIQKLRCFCTHPSVYDNSYSDINPLIISSKYQRCCELIEEIISNNEKVLIFTSFNRMSEILEQDLSKRFNIYVNHINGSISSEKRQEIVDEFSELDSSAILILNPKAAGTGLNITAANHAIFYNSEWNPAIDDQASCRIFRIGQDKPVFIYRLFYTNTIEEIINDRVQKKREISDIAVVGNNGELEDIERVLKLGQIGTSEDN